MKNFTKILLSALIGCSAMPAMAQTDDVTVLGGLLNKNPGVYSSNTLTKNQYYTFNASTDLDFQKVSEKNFPTFKNYPAVIFFGDKILGIGEKVYDIFSQETMALISGESGLALKTPSGFEVSCMQDGAAYDEESSLVYMLYYNANYKKCLLSFNLDTRDVVEIGELTMSDVPYSLAYSPVDRNLYTVIMENGGNLVKIDKATAECTMVGDGILEGTSFDSGQYAVSSTIGKSGKMYAIGQDRYTNVFLCSIDTETGKGEFITQLPGKEKFLGLHIVSEPAAETNIPAESVTLSDNVITLSEEGESYTLTYEVTPADTTDEAVWSSSDPAVATVEGGVVTAVANGTAVITLTVGNVSATCDVTVSINSGINEMAVDGAAVRYYNLQGIEIANPEKGQTVIVRQGNTAVKTIVR